MINREMRLNEGASTEKLDWKIEGLIGIKIFNTLGVSKALNRPQNPQICLN